jgi:dephospho-CoA kinase
MFSVLGIPVYDADSEAKRLMVEDAALKSGIKSLFGIEAYVEDKLNNKFIAQAAFTDPQKLQQLNALVHPAVIAHGEEWMQSQTAPYALKEAALIFESGSHNQLDYVIGVWCPEEIRISRILKRDNITKDMALARIGKQMDEREKMERCDFIITNDEQKAIIPQVLELHRQLLHKT